jgi:hypothetical protein
VASANFVNENGELILTTPLLTNSQLLGEMPKQA